MPNALTTKHILIIAGDPSADRHGAALIDSLRTRQKNLRFSALGGSYLKSKADHFLYPLVGVGGFGFWEPLMKLPQLWDARRKIKEVLRNDRPDLVITMDYYGFNIRAARWADTAGIPVVYYISPQVWASRPGRVQALAEVVTKMLVIFPFEKELYQKAGVDVSFVGHPLLRLMPAPVDPSPTITVGLLPGSRLGTVTNHLPILVETASLLHREFPDINFIIFRPSELPLALYEQATATASWIQVITESDYQERSRLTLAISVSGTSALENMLLGVPMIIMFRLSAFTYKIAKRLIRISFIGIPNILAGKAVVPELIQDQATPVLLAAQTSAWLRHPEDLQKIRRELLALRATLGEDKASSAADEVLKLVNTSGTEQA